MQSFRLTLLVSVFAIFSSGALRCRAEEQPNVLFIAVDDLRPELGCYGAEHIRSPNIDKLAASGRLFERAYCQQAVCNPSRTSLMTGMRPDSIGVTGNHSHFREKHPNVVTLPQHFKAHGYHAAAIGKIYHGVFPDGASITKWDTMGDPQSWSEPATRFGPRYYYTEAGIAAAKQVFQQIYKPSDPGPDDWTKKLVFGPATESPDVPDNVLYDGQVADAAIAKLRTLNDVKQPFFLAIGFIKPHSPYIAPKKYFDLYDDVTLPSIPQLPTDAPKLAGHTSGELRRYTDQPGRGNIPEQNQRRVRQAYFACISYIDAQIGRVLNELDRTGLADNTIVVLWGDHGYHLGEHGLWGKTTNFELDTRVPLIVRTPKIRAAGQSTSSLVELVDLYPTLAELAELPITEQLDGKSFVPILSDPKRVTKSAALSQYPRGGGLMGYSLRTPTHRLTQWVHHRSGQVRATELYDYADGPVETMNIASSAPGLVETLSSQLISVAKSKENSNDHRPNILFIVSEDNSDHLGCYGERRVHTPHLDELADGGVRYARAYVPYSVCSPSRAAFLTGLYTRQNGHIGLATHRFSMYRDFKTLPAYFQEAGYYTGFLGKTHVNPERLVEDYIDYRAIKGSNFGKTTSIEQYAAEARTVMQKAADAKKPFLLIINYADAHRQFIGKSKNGFPMAMVEEEIAPYPWIGSDSPHLRRELQNYLNCINRLDEGIGMVLRNLGEMQVRDSTLVIYISDHGADFPRGKGSIYENGTRIPMIVNYPKSFPTGKVEDAMVSTIDILPTMLTAAGLPVPDQLPGVALQDLDSGKIPPREYIHTFTTGSSPNLLYMQFGIRDDRYKLVYSPDRALNRLAISRYKNSQLPEDQHVEGFLHPPEYELFDLHKDPHEWKNLSDSTEHQAIKLRLREAMLNFQHRINDPFADPDNIATFIAEQKEYQKKPYKKSGFRWPHLDMFAKTQEAAAAVTERQVIFAQRDIPAGVPREGHAKDAKKYGYRIPSLLVTKRGSILAFSERRLGLHDHAQNDIVLKRSTDGGKTWSDEIVAYEDGANSINDPLTAQLENGRILLMFARFPYGRHARDAGWIKMADLGYDDPTANVLTFICHSDDDGLTWSTPVDISRQVKHPKLLNANTPGAMIQLSKGPHKGRVVAGLWGTLPIIRDGKRSREWRNVVVHSDDNGETWKRTDFLRDNSGKGFGNECQIAEAANGHLVLISRNQGGALYRKKAISRDGGETWTPLNIDHTLPSVACMGSVIKGPPRGDGTWDLWASFPSKAGRKNGRIAVSKDNGQTWQIVKVIDGPFAYSALQVSPDQQSLLCFYESEGYRSETLLTIPFRELDDAEAEAKPANPREHLQANDSSLKVNPRPNVLFISVDDWNDWVGCLGNNQAQTPHVDRLAKRGLLFTNAHCVAPVCNPSRVATLTGLRPETTGVYENNHRMRGKARHVVTLPQHFRQQGYHVAGGGKVFHDVPPHCDDPASWDEYFWWNEHGAKGGRFGNSWRSPYSIPPDPALDNRPIRRITPLTKRNFDWGAVDQPESDWPDSKVASWATDFLSREHQRPFFLAVGMFRPHVPWFNPRKYVEQYSIDDIALPLVKDNDLDDLGLWAKNRALDGASKHDQLVEFGEWKPAVQAYLASISFADANVGRVLDALDKSRYRDNTIIVFWSDHGYHLGEKGHWHKRTLWERSTHVPLIVVAPGITQPGAKCSRAVSLLDLYPTLISLCGLDSRRELEGHDLAPLLSKPQSSWPHAAVTTWNAGNRSIRTERWRYIRYATGEEELYDHNSDPHEWHNVAANSEFAGKKIDLAKHLPASNDKEHAK